jgi:hypothetical protein
MISMFNYTPYNYLSNDILSVILLCFLLLNVSILLWLCSSFFRYNWKETISIVILSLSNNYSVYILFASHVQ